MASSAAATAIAIPCTVLMTRIFCAMIHGYKTITKHANIFIPQMTVIILENNIFLLTIACCNLRAISVHEYLWIPLPVLLQSLLLSDMQPVLPVSQYHTLLIRSTTTSCLCLFIPLPNLSYNSHLLHHRYPKN